MDSLNKKIYPAIILLIIFIFFLSCSAEAVGVRPLTVDMFLEQGETEEFTLELTPSDAEELVELNLHYPHQDLSGSLSYEVGDPDEHEVINWIDMPDEVTVPPGEEVEVTGEVNVPFDAEGSHTAVIMVEPVVEDEEGITLQVRYAVRVNIHVDAPGLREDAELLDFDLEADEEDQPLLTAHMENPSQLMYDAAGEVTVRDEDRQLIERVTIETPGGGEETTIYPGAEVLFEGNITEPLAAGQYDLQAFIYYGDGRQIIERKTVEVGDEFIDP